MFYIRPTISYKFIRYPHCVEDNIDEILPYNVSLYTRDTMTFMSARPLFLLYPPSTFNTTYHPPWLYLSPFCPSFFCFTNLFSSPLFLKLNFTLSLWLPLTILSTQDLSLPPFYPPLHRSFVYPSLFDIRLSNYHVRKLPWLSRQSDRLLTDRSLVRSQAEAPFLLFCSLIISTYIVFISTVKKVRLPWVSNPRPRG